MKLTSFVLGGAIAVLTPALASADPLPVVADVADDADDADDEGPDA